MPSLQHEYTVDLLRALRAQIKKAADDGALDVTLEEINEHVVMLDPPAKVSAAALPRLARAIRAGTKDFKRKPESAILRRPDRAWLHFTLTVGEQRGSPLSLVAYNFELVYADGHTPGFVRFDLNQIGHANDELRAHIHPGHRDVLLPAPILHPVEALDLLIGLPQFLPSGA